MIKYQITIVILAIVLFTGCGTSINLTKYSPMPLQKAQHIPSKEKLLSNSLYKVIIMDIDNGGMEIAEQSKLGTTIATNINTLLAKAKSVKLIKRVNKSSYLKMLEKEIEASELSKELGTDVGQADYIITGKLSNATYDHSFQEGYYYYIKTKKGKIRKYSSPRMRYSSCASGNIKIFSLPTLNEADSFDFHKCSGKSTEVRSSRDVVRRNDGLVRESGVRSAYSVSYPLKNFFAKKGYIYEMKSDDGDKIVKVNLGTNHGAVEGEDIDIYSIEDSYNSLTEETKKETVKIGVGQISNQLTTTSAWIIIDELEDGKKIKAGNFVKIKYTKGFFD